MVVIKMDAIIIARYAPLVMPQNLNAFPTGDYMKYMPRYNGEGYFIVEEHMVAFYNFGDNLNIEHADVWMRLFVQSLDGEIRKRFHGLPLDSIAGIKALDEAFLKQRGDRRYYIYYITQFGDLRRNNGESMLDFIKMFKKMYNKIPNEIKPTKTSAKIRFTNAFDA
jgi:hypothetical protein